MTGFLDLVAEGAQWLALIIALASAFCAATHTPGDTGLRGRLYRFLEVLALNIGHAKEKPGEGREGR
jgi:hypothetical protein